MASLSSKFDHIHGNQHWVFIPSLTIDTPSTNLPIKILKKSITVKIEGKTVTVTLKGDVKEQVLLEEIVRKYASEHITEARLEAKQYGNFYFNFKGKKDFSTSGGRGGFK